MKLNKIFAAVSAIMLLTACETAPTDGANKDGSGQNLDRYGNPIAAGVQGEIQQVGDRVFFALDSSALDEEGKQTLEKQAAILQRNSGAAVTIEGHCDERGTREYNLALGERRAAAAKKYLAGLGVNASRITTVSYGKERPAVIGSDESAWGQNRRAVTVVTNQ